MRSERIPAFTLSSLPVCVPYFLSRFSSAAFCFQQPAHPLLPLFLSWHSLLPTSMSRERWSCKMGWLWWPWASRMNQASGLQWRGHLHRGCWTRLRQEPWCWFGRCPKALSCFFPAGAWLNHTWHSSKPSWLHADGLVCTGTSSASAVILEGMNQTAAGGIKLLGPFTEVRVLQTPCWGLCYSMIGCCCCLLERPNSSFGLRTNQPTNQPGGTSDPTTCPEEGCDHHDGDHSTATSTPARRQWWVECGGAKAAWDPPGQSQKECSAVGLRR